MKIVRYYAQNEYRFICRNCGCEFEADFDEVLYFHPWEDGSEDTSREAMASECPICKSGCIQETLYDRSIIERVEEMDDEPATRFDLHMTWPKLKIEKRRGYSYERT